MGTNIPNSYSDRLCCYFEQNGVCKYMESCKFCHNNTVVNFESKDFEQVVDDKDLKVTHKEDLDQCQTDFKEEDHKEQTDFKEEDHKEQTDFKDENHDDHLDNQEENLKTKKDLREKKIHKEKQKQLPKIKCRYFIIGNCKNGEMCRFAHMTYSSDSKKIEALKIKEHSANIKNDPGCTEKHSAKIKNDSGSTKKYSANKKKVFPNKKEDSDNINNDYNNIKEGKKKNIKEGEKKNIKDGVSIISDYSDDTVKEFKIIKVETSTIVKKSNAVKKLLNCKHFMSKNGCKHGNKCLFKHYRSTSDAADEPSTSDAADEPFASDAAYELSTSDAVDVLSKLSNEIKHCSTNDANKTLNHSYTEYKKDCVNPSIRMQDSNKIVDFATDDMLLSNVTSDISNVCSINSSNGNMLMSPIDNILQVSKNNPSNPQNDLNLQNDDPQNVISNYESLKPYDKMLKGNKLKKCRFYFSNSGCRRKDLCKFLHVDFKGRNFETLETNPIEDKLKHSENQHGNIKSFENFIDFEKLRSTELLQLEKRFKNSLKSKLESTDIYTVTIEPSDPDWPYIVKAFTLSFSFPKDYPQELFKVCLENIGGVYPDGFTEFMNEFLQEWLEKRSKDHTVTDLAFRPFIRWFDRNLETLFTSSATKVKRQQDALRAGLTFIPHNKILGSSNIFKSVNLPYETPEKNVTDHELISNEDITQNDFQYNDTMENQFQYNENMENQFQINYSESNSSQIKKGVEVKFPKMSIMNIGTLKLTDLALTICCDRCKLRTDVKLKDQVFFATSCSKCKTVHSVAFYSELMHQISNVAGYLHLYGCKPFDLILSDSVVTLNCFKCIRDNFLQGISYGSPRHHWCTFCHEKMGIEIPAVQFNTLQPAVASVLDTKVKAPPKLKVVRDPSIKDGAPLPENGACKHYKKSYRWFRFPCCGKVFPCDKCHEESSNDGHEMLLATKMLCGFCAKEQRRQT
ncbi:MATH and LRR domain-containing protein PFE0570w isoform X2 [Hydra vulgaris]|uniref:MATH and LRR domain-containing protein PFE0570w isoform X2 n=1 Tax=Hydra vulgaris TaxID=6087 RepID=UPI001F5FC744|nr:MATH and LRR domain-containing protein PFE0570w isoform X2 [Hydra vulgaris]